MTFRTRATRNPLQGSTLSASLPVQVTQTKTFSVALASGCTAACGSGWTPPNFLITGYTRCPSAAVAASASGARPGTRTAVPPRSRSFHDSSRFMVSVTDRNRQKTVGKNAPAHRAVGTLSCISMVDLTPKRVDLKRVAGRLPRRAFPRRHRRGSATQEKCRRLRKSLR